MEIFNEIQALVKTEKSYTLKILLKLKFIEKDKLYSDLKYPSLHKYIVKELKYSDARATIFVNSVRLMLKSKKAQDKIEAGELSLSNAADANKFIKFVNTPKEIDQIITKATDLSNREFKRQMHEELKLPRNELVVIPDHLQKKFDQLRKIYGDVSAYEIISILVEERLSIAPTVSAAKRSGRSRSFKVANSRFIAKSVKRKVYTGKCCICSTRYNLEYDHIVKFSHGGDNSEGNIQQICRNCNQRKEIITRQSNFFT